MDWYKKSYRRNLIDMHITDSDDKFLSQFSSENYIAAIKKAKVDTAIIYAGSCLGINYYLTKYGYMHKNLNGRDILKETIEASRNNGLNVVVYFNIWSRYAYDNHPEWRMIDVNGKGYQVDMGQRFGQCCPNTEYSEYVRNMISEIVGSYDMDGLWIDMIGWFGAICYCPKCRARYMKEAGKEIPQTIDWADKDFLNFVRKREEWFAQMAEMITSTTKNINKNITVTQQCASWTLGWTGGTSKEFFSQSDYLAGDFYEGPVEQAVICKYLSNITKNRPIEYMVSRCTDLTEHTLNKSYETIMAQRYSALANNCAFVFIDAIDPVGTIDNRIYDQLGRIFGTCAKYEEYIEYDAEIEADVGIILSQKSMVNFNANGKNISESDSEMNTLKGIYRIAESLLDAKITFDVLDLSDYNKISRKKFIILSDLIFLSDDEIELLKKYAMSGGIIYASGRTSLCDPIKGKNKDFSLSEILGVSWICEEKDIVNYISPIDEYSEMLGNFNSAYPLSVSGNFQRIEANEGVQILGTLTKCYYRPNDINEFASAISNPPGIPTATPALTKNNFGKGIALYSSGAFEVSVHEASRKVLVSIIKHHIAELLIRTDAPKPVEMIVYRNSTGYQINMLNFQHKLPPIPICDMSVQLYIGNASIDEIFDVDQDRPIDFVVEDGYAAFTVKNLNYFNILRIKLKN